MNIILPTIHMNGTGAQTLLDDYTTAFAAVGRAVDAIQNVEFSARDYYVAPGAWERARARRQEIMAQLAAIREEMMSHAMLARDVIAAKAEREASRAPRA